MAAAKEKLLTLSEVSRRTSISMPTLLRYKKQYQGQIPSRGQGRKQRYPASAIAIFEGLKRDRMAARKAASGDTQGASGGTKARAGARRVSARYRHQPASMGPATPEGLVSLNEIGRQTGISYPTLVRYVKLYLDQLPHRGQGRRRRFKPEAVEVFARLRGESRRGRRPGAGAGAAPRMSGAVAGSSALARRLAEVERAQKQLARQMERLLEEMRKPINLIVRR